MAKTLQSAVFGKLIPAVLKALGKRVTGLNMNKVIHIMNNAQHGLDKLSPSEIVYEVIKVASKQASGLTSVYIILATGEIIRIIVKVALEGGAVGIGTAYVIEKIAEAVEDL